MIIISLQKHFAARAPEWFAAFTMMWWGVYLQLHPHLFPDPRLGVVAIAVGASRAVALFINGYYTRTPMIRLATAFLSGYIWTQVVVGILNSGVPNLGLVMYASAIVADMYSAYRAANDVVHAERQRRENKAEDDRVTTSNVVA